MGSRMYVIKQTDDGFIASYTHWGAERVYDAARRGASAEELFLLLRELHHYGLSKHPDMVVKLKSIEELYKFVDFTRIDIEIYAILWKDRTFNLFLTFIVHNYVQGALRVDRGELEEYKNPWALNWALTERSKVHAIISFLDVWGFKREEASKILRENWCKMKNRHEILYDIVVANNLHEGIQKGLTLPLRNNIKCG